MPDHSLPGDPVIPLTLRRSGRARRISLRVSHLDGRVTLTLPAYLPEDEALAFARSKEGWIRDHLAKLAPDIYVDFGALIPVAGVPRRIEATDARRGELLADRLLLPKKRPCGATAQGFLRDLARDRLTAASDRYAAQLGRHYSRITLRDTRSRWGSCSSKGALMYSWRLILAPAPVLDYVAAHEVAHLAEMNHSAAFWSVVARLYGPWEEPRHWLHENGSHLHAYRFTA